MKKHLAKSLLFIAIVVVLQVVIASFTGDNSGYRQLADERLKNPVDVLYFGDSSIWYLPKEDKNKRPVNAMLAYRLPGLRVKTIAGAAYHMNVYESFCSYITGKEASKHPRLVIIPINLRSFSPHWDLMPEYQFKKEQIELEGGLLNIFYRPLKVFKYPFGTLSRREYDMTPVYKGSREMGPIRKMAGVKRHLIMRYMYGLTKNHRKIKSMDAIAGLLQEKGIIPLFYITPVDVEEGEKRLQGEFKKQLLKNIALIRSVLEARNINLLDFSCDLGSNYFAWRKTAMPNEHLNQQGRLYVAKKLAGHVKKIFSKKHKDPKQKFLGVQNPFYKKGFGRRRQNNNESSKTVALWPGSS